MASQKAGGDDDWLLGTNKPSVKQIVKEQKFPVFFVTLLPFTLSEWKWLFHC